MKRIVPVILVLSILLISCSPSQEDEVTGEVVIELEPEPTTIEEPVEEVIEETLEPEEEIRTVRLCHDTDNGQVQWEKGKIFGYYEDATRFEMLDQCVGNNGLFEYYCENEYPKEASVFCRNGCVDGACL